MKREIISVTKLTASEGHILTDGENYGRIVFPASGDDGSKWYEITAEEYNKILEEKERNEMP